MKTRISVPLDGGLNDELAELAALPDEAIDYSDSPPHANWSGAVRGKYSRQSRIAAGSRIALPEPVARIYQAVEELEARYPGRKFTPDGHLVGSIGEVIAAEEFGLKLRNMSHPQHDAWNDDGNIQIKMTAGKNIAMYSEAHLLLVLRLVISENEVEVVYYGSGYLPWREARKPGKNKQRVISLAKLKTLMTTAL